MKRARRAVGRRRAAVAAGIGIAGGAVAVVALGSSREDLVWRVQSTGRQRSVGGTLWEREWPRTQQAEKKQKTNQFQKRSLPLSQENQRTNNNVGNREKRT